MQLPVVEDLNTHNFTCNTDKKKNQKHTDRIFPCNRVSVLVAQRSVLEPDKLFMTNTKYCSGMLNCSMEGWSVMWNDIGGKY